MSGDDATSTTSRQAVRETQRLASQLHQLIAASLTVGSLQNPSAIVTNLARSTRSVFDADEAMVVLDHGPFAPLAGVAVPAKPPRLLTGSDGSRAPWSTLGPGREPRVDGDWLVAPVALGHAAALGSIGLRRDQQSAPYRDEDREILTLLAQMTATAVSSLQLNQTIADNESRLRHLVDAAPVAIIESDTNGDVRWWNHSASRIFEWPDFGDDLTVVRWPADTRRSLEPLWRDLVAGRPVSSYEFEPAPIAGRERILTASVTLVPTQSGHGGILTLIDDVTDQRALKEEVRHAGRMELRGQVASSIAHDFNNLLTLISGYTELLAMDVKDERSAQLVRDIQTTASRASSLTAQLQSLGRTSVAESVVLDPNAALNANAEVLERVLGATIDVDWQLDQDARAIRTDADLFEQMVINLSMNARDAMEGGGTLTFRTANVALEADNALELAPGEYVQLSIADTGAGMDEATQLRCFEPLFTTKGPLKGTGMGLAASRRLVEDSGGRITVVSAPGAGTTFTLLFPAQASPPVTAVAPQALGRLTGTVLLADDDDSLRQMMVQVLRRNGFTVLEASSSAEAQVLAADNDGRIDLLVSDVVMPGGDGPALAALLQAGQPTLGVLLVSGTADASVTSHLDPQRSAFLAKPFRPSALVDEVHGLLTRLRSL